VAAVLSITRKLEFDAGHRIPDHRSQCRNLHGHRYVLEITLEGELVDVEGAPDRGMVMDFADVKALANEHLVHRWDHAFLVYEGDQQVRAFLDTMPVESLRPALWRGPAPQARASLRDTELLGRCGTRLGPAQHRTPDIGRSMMRKTRNSRCAVLPGVHDVHARP